MDVSHLHHITPLTLHYAPSKSLAFHAYFDPATLESVIEQYQTLQPDGFIQWHPKRQHEFLAGRLLSIHALHQLSTTDTSIVHRERLAPLWPKGHSGCISHKHNSVAVWVNPTSDTFLGMDLEHIFSTQQAKRLQKRLLTPLDQTLLSQHNEAWLTTLIYSAKESLYKLLHPQVHGYFGFQAASMVALDLQQQTFTLKLHQSLSEQHQKNDVYQGAWHTLDTSVITYLHLSSKK